MALAVAASAAVANARAPEPEAWSDGALLTAVGGAPRLACLQPALDIAGAAADADTTAPSPAPGAPPVAPGAGADSAAATPPATPPAPRTASRPAPEAPGFGLLRADRLQHASLSLTLGLSFGLMARSPRLGFAAALATGVAKELYDARHEGFDVGDLAADALGAVTAALCVAGLDHR